MLIFHGGQELVKIVFTVFLKISPCSFEMGSLMPRN